MANYYKTLADIMKNPKPDGYSSMSRAEIEAAVATISTLLTGPLSNEDRLVLVADRTDLRAALDKLP